MSKSEFLSVVQASYSRGEPKIHAAVVGTEYEWRIAGKLIGKYYMSACGKKQMVPVSGDVRWHTDHLARWGQCTRCQRVVDRQLGVAP